MDVQKMDRQLNVRIEFLRKQMEVTAEQRGSLLHGDVIALSQLLDEYIMKAQYEYSPMNELLTCAL